ncbi:MAG: hypothetical protein EBX38_04180, partial [Actinobacteria bacterium]|nr:hypothetical protein [Actinomycetota bacterium]
MLTIDGRLAPGLHHLTVAQCPQPLAQIDGLALEHVESSGDDVRPSAAQMPTIDAALSAAAVPSSAAAHDSFRL